MISSSEDALIEIIGMKMIGYYMILTSNALLLAAILGNLLKNNQRNQAQGGLSVADGCRCLTKELDMIAC